ncbi:MAG: hypothetical protein LUD02_12325 [Tannerellaceae bacterium]|nr:hypothetical protein [Tannerellaceae bacterium]
MKRYLLPFFIVLLFSGCAQNTPLENALQLARHNQEELIKVLEYYKKEPGDSLKYKAACFLIENMVG